MQPPIVSGSVDRLYRAGLARYLSLCAACWRTGSRSGGMTSRSLRSRARAYFLPCRPSPDSASDLDLLVPARDLPAIRSALAELGYEPGLQLTQAAERAYLKSGYEYIFDGAHGRNLVEVMWQILPRFYSIGFEVDNFSRGPLGSTWRGTNCERSATRILCWCFASTQQNTAGCNLPGCVTLPSWLDPEPSTGEPCE